MPSGVPGFYEILTQAVAYFGEHGYGDEAALVQWMRLLRQAAEADLLPLPEVERQISTRLGSIYQRLVERAGLLKHHPGVARFTINQLRPQLRAELDRRIMASVGLIKLHREEAVSETLRRFAGWATSIPPGGAADIRRAPVKTRIRQELARTPYRKRVVDIDQGHKLTANLHDILATGSGAIAAVWQHHHVRYPRAEHLRRDGTVFLIRGSWAHQAGLVKPLKAGFTDEVERPGELPMCRCSSVFLSSLRQLPPGMLTAKGKTELARINALLAA